MQTNESYLEKVTAFITRSAALGTEILLFRHPTAGNQFPAGTVEPGESFDAAALREAHEETGLSQLRLVTEIGAMTESRKGSLFVGTPTKVYAQPTTTSFDWATLPRGIQVRMLRQQGEFVQVSYEEGNRFPDPEFTTYQITGWVPQGCLRSHIRRHLYHLTTDAQTPAEWGIFVDHHEFRPFWAPLNHLPEIVWPQNLWLEYALQELGYHFG